MNLQLVYRYYLSLLKNGNMFYGKNKKTKGPKKKEESPTWTFNVLSVAPRLLIVKAPVILILNSLLMKICQSTLFEGGRAILMKN